MDLLNSYWLSFWQSEPLSPALRYSASRSANFENVAAANCGPLSDMTTSGMPWRQKNDLGVKKYFL